MAFYPVNLDIHDHLCVVIGGGSVATRKVESLITCGARVTVISPSLCDRLEALHKKGEISLINREYRSGDLEGSLLVFAATDQPEVQKEIVAEATARSIFINVADSPQECSFQVPSSLRRQGLLLTVSTGGGCPFLAAKIRGELEEKYGSEYGALVMLLSLIRKQLLRLNQSEMNTKKLFEKLLALNILVHIRTKKWEKIKDMLVKVLPEQVDVDLVMDKIRQK